MDQIFDRYLGIITWVTEIAPIYNYAKINGILFTVDLELLYPQTQALYSGIPTVF